MRGGKKSGHFCHSSGDRYTKKTAKETEQSQRTVRRAVRRSKKVKVLSNRWRGERASRAAFVTPDRPANHNDIGVSVVMNHTDYPKPTIPNELGMAVLVADRKSRRRDFRRNRR